MEPLFSVVLPFVRMAGVRATSVDIIEIFPISPNTLSYKIHLLLNPTIKTHYCLQISSKYTIFGVYHSTELSFDRGSKIVGLF